MILKASDMLRIAVLGIPKPRLIPIPGKAEAKDDMSLVSPLVPPWLADMMADGQYVLMDQEEYDGLPMEVRFHLEVIRR